MGRQLDASDLWDAEDGDHLWFTYSGGGKSGGQEIRVIDVDKTEYNDGTADVEIVGEILWEDAEGDRAWITTTRGDDVSEWSNPKVYQSYDTNESPVETLYELDAADIGWDERAHILYTTTILGEDEAAVQALSERGLTHSEIGDILTIPEDRIDELTSRVEERVSLAEETVSQLT